MMKRTKHTQTPYQIALNNAINDIAQRAMFANKFQMGWSYGDKRKLYTALGYPEDKDLTFEYFHGRYERQDIASAIIDRPVEGTWGGDLTIIKDGEQRQDSTLSKEWEIFEEKFHVKEELRKLDKLVGLGQFGLLLFGFNDVKNNEDFKTPLVKGSKRKLLYLKAIPQSAVTIEKWENKPSNERYGLPVIYKIKLEGLSGSDNLTIDLDVHYSRVLHVVEDNLLSRVYGQPRLKPIINRLIDIDKILGGDAEMFWRGARPGYNLSTQPDYELSQTEEENLATQITNFEHDLRRILSTKGVDIKALESQLADPLNHLDAQLQAISAQTGIPKRVLIGSERGELASSQDKDQWLTLLQTRRIEFAEPKILVPFVNKCMENGLITEETNWYVEWADMFAPSEKQRVEIGKIRASALKDYATNPFASEIMPPEAAAKYLFALDEEDAQEIEQIKREAIAEEDRMLNRQQEQEPIPEDNV